MLNIKSKIVLILFCLLVIFLFSSATGELEIKKGWKEYRVRALDMSINFPDDYLVLYKDMSPDDSILLNYEVTPEQINAELGAQYLNAYSEAQNSTYIISMVTSGIPFETEKLTQEDLVRNCINDICIAADKDGSEVINVVIDNDEFGFYGIYELRQQAEYGMVRTYNYFSFKNSVAILVCGYVMEDEYSDEFRDETYQVFDSIKYWNVIGNNEAGIRYEDRIGEISFLWPAGYYKPHTELEKDMLVHEVFIKGIPDDRIIIQYMCLSVVNETHSIQDKMALSRLDTDKMSLTEFMEQMFSYQGPFYEENHGQHKFFKRNKDSITMIAIKNAKVYYFMYSGEENDEYYPDFIKLVDSVMFTEDME